MIKEVVESKIVDSMDSIVDCVAMYLGDKYKHKLFSKIENVKVVLVRGNGVVKLDDEVRLVGEEPVCVKNEHDSYILIPVSILGEKSGNVIFVHQVIHALSEDEKFDYSDLKEVIIDYMANDIAKILEKNNINVTLEKEPSYESSSFYSNLFPVVEDFYLNNKNDFFDCLFNGEAKEIDGIDEVSEKVDVKINEFLMEKSKNIKNMSKR